MNSLERPAPEKPSENGDKPEVLYPAEERLGAGVSESHDAVITARAAALEKALDQGMVPEAYAESWDKARDYIAAARWERDPEVIAQYFENPENEKIYNQLANDIKAGKPLKEILDAEGKSPNAESLRALEFISIALKEGVMTEGGKGADEARLTWQDLTGKEQEKRTVRLAEILNLEVRTLQALHQLNQPSQEEITSLKSELSAYTQNDDIPEYYRFYFRDAALDLKSQYPESGQVSTAEAVSESAVPSTGAQPESSAQVPEAILPIARPEKIFNREMITPEDCKAMSREVSKLLAENTPQSMYQAARQLAHLKRAGIRITDPQKIEQVHARLTARLQDMREAAPLEQAKYLGYLKYLGVDAASVVEPQDRQRLELAAVKAQSEHMTSDLAQLAIWNKYLGIGQVTEGVKQALQADLKQKAAQPENAAKTAVALGRLKYLGVPHALPAEQVKTIYQDIDQKTAKAYAGGRWGAFIRLHILKDYFDAPRLVPKPHQQKLTERLRLAQQEVRDKGGWSRLIPILGNVAHLSRTSQAAETKGAAEPSVRYSTRDSEIAQFLGELSEQHRTAEKEATDRTKRGRAAA